MAARPRDFQRSRVYKAEDAAFGKQPEITLAEAEAMVAGITESRWWLGKFGVRWVEVTDGRGRRSACLQPGFPDLLKLPRHGRKEWVVLHELAHSAASDRHGPRFCQAYLALVKRWLGQEEAQRLRQSFREHRVRLKASGGSGEEWRKDFTRHLSL